MTRDEFRNALRILMGDSGTLPANEMIEELERAVAEARKLASCEAFFSVKAAREASNEPA